MNNHSVSFLMSPSISTRSVSRHEADKSLVDVANVHCSFPVTRSRNRVLSQISPLHLPKKAGPPSESYLCFSRQSVKGDVCSRFCETVIRVSTNFKGSDRVIGNSNRREQENLVILNNPHGSGGECRRDYHCGGRQKCVRRLGRYQ